MGDTLLKWNPPLIAAGSLEVFNRYGKIGANNFVFQLVILWESNEVVPAAEEQTFTRGSPESDNYEVFSLIRSDCGNVRISYRGRLTATLRPSGEIDETDERWEAVLNPYSGTGMCYIGMWQMIEASTSRTSTAEARALAAQKRRNLLESMTGWGCMLLIVAICVAITVVLFRY